VLDFGLAALRAAPGATVTTETLTAANMLTGTLPYMAPEQLLGKPAEARTDLYALGVLLYELATGTRPFEAAVQAALIGEILHKTAAAPSSRRPGIPLWFDGIVARCLDKEMSGRFENASALKAVLKTGTRAAFAAPSPGGDPSAGAGGAASAAGRAARDAGSGSHAPFAAVATPPTGSATPISGYPAGSAGQNVNPEAYDAVLRGRQIIGRRTEESMRRGIEYLRRAIEIDPLYAPAYAALATAYDLMGFFAMATPVDCFPRARVAANRAIERDPTWAPAYAALAYVSLYYDWDLRTAEDLFRRCIELDPQYAIGHLWYSNILVFEHRNEEADAAIDRAQALDPLSSIVTMSHGWAAMFSRDSERALREYKRATDFDPDFHVAHWMTGWCLNQLGRHEEAVAAVTKAIEASKGLLICYPELARSHALAGRSDEARRILAELEAKSPARHIMPLEVAVAYEALGERDIAMAWLERALKERAHWLIAANADPRFDSMREDARFVAVIEKVGARN
jgi:tetratricopeptide (TPR) repeat protein